MKLAICISAICTTLISTGCATNQNQVVSSDASILVVGEEPQGYPITTNIQIGNFCTWVTESWAPGTDPASGQKLWLKQVARAQSPCK